MNATANKHHSESSSSLNLFIFIAIICIGVSGIIFLAVMSYGEFNPESEISRFEQTELHALAQDNEELASSYNEFIEDGKFTNRERDLFQNKVDDLIGSPIN